MERLEVSLQYSKVFASSPVGKHVLKVDITSDVLVTRSLMKMVL